MCADCYSLKCAVVGSVAMVAALLNAAMDALVFVCAIHFIHLRNNIVDRKRRFYSSVVVIVAPSLSVLKSREMHQMPARATKV